MIVLGTESLHNEETDKQYHANWVSEDFYHIVPDRHREVKWNCSQMMTAITISTQFTVRSVFGAKQRDVGMWRENKSCDKWTNTRRVTRRVAKNERGNVKWLAPAQKSRSKPTESLSFVGHYRHNVHCLWRCLCSALCFSHTHWFFWIWKRFIFTFEISPPIG